jgi:hypothetical protein
MVNPVRPGFFVPTANVKTPEKQANATQIPDRTLYKVA